MGKRENDKKVWWRRAGDGVNDERETSVAEHPGKPVSRDEEEAGSAERRTGDKRRRTAAERGRQINGEGKESRTAERPAVQSPTKQADVNIL